MRYWIIKLNPRRNRPKGDSPVRSGPHKNSGSFNWEALVKQRQVAWDWVKEPYSSKKIGEVRKGDLLVIYQTEKDPRTDRPPGVVGFAEAVGDAYLWSPSDVEDKPRPAVDISPTDHALRPIGSDFIRQFPAPTRQASVVEITPHDWETVRLECGARPIE